MLRAELNERMSRVGPGTPGGALLRRYWLPIAGEAELTEKKPTKRVRILGEDLVLYRDLSGNLGLVDEPCAHRRVSLAYGIPEPNGIRCPYHGWLYDETGQCIEQPGEPDGSTFKDRVQIKAYPVQTLGGLIFTYMGKAPVPLLPRYDLFVLKDAVRQIGINSIPCNWVQCMENSLDPVHNEWLHAYYGSYLTTGRGKHPEGRGEHVKLGFDRFQHGIIKRRVERGYTEDDDDWKVGHPVIFPHILKVGSGYASTFQIRVPVDDYNTLHFYYRCFWFPGLNVPEQKEIPVHYLPLKDADGEFVVDYTLGQDLMAWATQGALAARDQERLGVSDTGIIMYREMLLEQIDRVERGEDPIDVYRDPAANEIIELPVEKAKFGAHAWVRRGGTSRGLEQYMPLPPETAPLFEQAKDREESGRPLLQEPLPTFEELVSANDRREVVLRAQ